MKKIIAFAGSNSSTSINRQLVQHTLGYFSEFDLTFLDLNDFEMPIFSVDREKEGFPPQAQQFIQAITQADAIICSLAEHNRSYTVAFKNIMDWCSRLDMNFFHNKPMMLMSTSPGGYGGGNVMKAAHSFFPKCGADVVTTFSLPSFYQNFTAGKISDEDLHNEHQEKIQFFKEKALLGR